MASNPLVLVADDEPSMLELVADHLRTMTDPKVDVVQATDGEEAYRLAQGLLPDLVVLDVMMPGMSGWEVCRKIREDVGRFAHTGVVMLTGIGENLNHMTSPLYGADFYIDKPFDFIELEKKVRQALRDRAEQREGVSRPPLNGHGAEGGSKRAKSAKKAAPGKKAVPAKAVAAPKNATASKKAPAKPAAKVAKKKVTKKAVKTAKRAPLARPKAAAKSRKPKTSAAKAKPSAAKGKPGAKAKKKSARR